MMTTANSEGALARMRGSIMLRLCGIGGLMLLLGIPIGLVSSTIRERQQTRDEAVASVTQSWGRSQIIGGPFIVIPSVYEFGGVGSYYDARTQCFPKFSEDCTLVNSLGAGLMLILFPALALMCELRKGRAAKRPALRCEILRGEDRVTAPPETLRA